MLSLGTKHSLVQKTKKQKRRNMVGKNKDEETFFSFLMFSLAWLSECGGGRLCDFHDWLFTCQSETVHLLWDEIVKLDGRAQLTHSNLPFHHVRLTK